MGLLPDPITATSKPIPIPIPIPAFRLKGKEKSKGKRLQPRSYRIFRLAVSTPGPHP